MPLAQKTGRPPEPSAPGRAFPHAGGEARRALSQRSAPRKVAVDGVIFQLQQGAPYGISRLWHSLLSELGQGPLAGRILMLDRAGTAPRIAGIERRSIPAFRLGGAASEADALDAFCREGRAGLFLSTYYTCTRETPSLLMLYDMIPERAGGVGPDAPGAEWRDKHWAIMNSDAFAAISESTARDLARFYPERAAGRSATVIPCAVSEGFHPPPPERVRTFQRSRGIGRPYFLLVGRRDPHKNVRLFFEAFARLADPERYAIVMAGGRGDLDPAFRSLAAGADIHIGFYPEPELPLLYGGARALVYPSRCEGFGLPLLEAMRCGCPVITCHNSSLFEVARHAALYVGEDDAAALSKALADVQRPSVRDYLIRSGIELSRLYSWKRSAQLLLEAIEALLRSRRRSAA
jgi:glycosyltransferase involved in cell wall biosynthesis